MEEELFSHNRAFQGYRYEHGLHPRDVATQSGVPYVTVWSILRNKPVTYAHATQVRAGLRKMTGVPYVGPIATLP